jgi:hypothetical protein
MLKVLRFVLLAMGCVVMVATSPVDQPYGWPTLTQPLRPGTAATFFFSAAQSENSKPVVPRVHLRGISLGEGAGARVVGIVSTAYPTEEGYRRLDPRGTFTVGQEVEGLGTVAFVREVPFDTRSAEGPWVLPGAEGYYLTVFAQRAGLELELTMPSEELQSECNCKVDFGFEPRREYFYFSPYDPDGGVGDGGVSDGGVSGRDGG